MMSFTEAVLAQIYVKFTNILFISIVSSLFFVYRYLCRPYSYSTGTLDEAKNNSYKQKLFPNCWIAVCGSDELKAASIKKVQFCGNNIILLRSSANGKPYALDAYCPHLGADLSVGGKIVKNCESDCVRCPFHGWVFRASDGAAIEVPYTKDKKGPSSVKIRTWECIEQNGFIFIWHHNEGCKPFWFPEKIEQIHNGKYKFIGSAEYIYNCPLLDSAENIADEAHANVLHSPLIMSLQSLEPTDIPLLNMIAAQNSFSWNKCDPPEDYKSQANLCSKVYFSDKYLISTLIADPVNQYGPCIMHIHNRLKFGPFSFEGVMMITQTPIGHNGSATKLVQKLYLKPDWFFRIFGRLYLILGIQQTYRDVVIFNNKIFIENPPYVKEEKQLVSFRRWVKKFYPDGNNKISCKPDLSW